MGGFRRAECAYVLSGGAGGNSQAASQPLFGDALSTTRSESGPRPLGAVVSGESKHSVPVLNSIIVYE